MKGGKTINSIAKIVGSGALGLASMFVKIVNDNAKKTQEIMEETNEKRKSLFKKAGLIFGSAAIGFTSLYFKIISGGAENKSKPKTTASTKQTQAKKTGATKKTQSNK